MLTCYCSRNKVGGPSAAELAHEEAVSKPNNCLLDSNSPNSRYLGGLPDYQTVDQVQAQLHKRVLPTKRNMLSKQITTRRKRRQ